MVVSNFFKKGTKATVRVAEHVYVGFDLVLKLFGIEHAGKDIQKI